MVHTDGARGPDGEFGAVGAFRVRGCPRQVWRTIAHVESQPQYMPGVKAAAVEAVEGDGTKLVHQVLKWGFLALQGDMHFHLEQREDPVALTISTKLRHGTMMRRFSSRVEVRDAGAGWCDVEMKMFMQPAIFVPPLIRHLVGAQVRRQLSTVLCALRDRLEQLGGGPGDGGGGDRGAAAAVEPAAGAALQTAAVAGAVSAAVADLRAVAVAAAVAAVAVGAAAPLLESSTGAGCTDGNPTVASEPAAAVAAAPAAGAVPAASAGAGGAESEDGFVFVTAADAEAEAAAAGNGSGAPQPEGLQMAALSPQAVAAVVAAAAAAEGGGAPAAAASDNSGEQWVTGSEEEGREDNEAASDGADDTAAPGAPDARARPAAAAAAVAKQAAAVARRASCDVVAVTA